MNTLYKINKSLLNNYSLKINLIQLGKGKQTAMKQQKHKGAGLRNREAARHRASTGPVQLKPRTCTKTHLHTPGNSLQIHTTLVKRDISARKQPACLLQAPAPPKTTKGKGN